MRAAAGRFPCRALSRGSEERVAATDCAAEVAEAAADVFASAEIHSELLPWQLRAVIHATGASLALREKGPPTVWVVNAFGDEDCTIF